MAAEFYRDILLPAAMCQLRTEQALDVFSRLCRQHLPVAIAAADGAMLSAADALTTEARTSGTAGAL